MRPSIAAHGPGPRSLQPGPPLGPTAGRARGWNDAGRGYHPALPAPSGTPAARPAAVGSPHRPFQTPPSVSPPAPTPRLSEFDYVLPPELIAQHPPAVRTASRLLRVRPGAEAGAPRLDDLGIADLPTLLNPGDLLVLNDTRVLRARLFGRKASGGRLELLVERIDGEHEAVAMIRASKPPQVGGRLELDGGAGATVRSRDGAFYGLVFDEPVPALLERAGSLPLPPYIGHAPDAEDEARYQTVYARHPGAVAAPTAGLHFDDALFAALQARGVHRAFVTLHVGAGTFLPMRDDDPDRHVMHSERYVVPEETVAAIAAARARGARVVAVGTTSMRTLESAAGPDGRIAPGSGETALFIRPGFAFRIVDALLTNFHLPKSTLMMLVSAFAGTDAIRAAYAHAIARRYRFFSYGDAMLLEPDRRDRPGAPR
jgi:S-adenosylmethionine:tRNA ribosyltransferase-isomerase